MRTIITQNLPINIDFSNSFVSFRSLVRIGELVFLMLVLVVGMSTNLNAQDELEALEDLLDRKVEAEETLGLSVSIYQNGKTYHFQKGFAKEEGPKVAPRTRFLNASTTKFVVAAALLKLEKQGKLSLQDPVSAFFPKVNKIIGRLTLEQLLSHTSGMKDRVEDFGENGPSKQIEFAHELTEEDLFTKPGEVYSYSNLGYNLLGAVIEQVENKEFNAAMKDLVFQPFEMNSTTFRQEELDMEEIAIGYQKRDQRFIPNPRLPDNARERASGMMLTTSNDLNKLLTWLVSQENELTQKQLSILASSSQTGADWQYGYGLFHSERCGEKVVWHTGGLPGYSALVFGIPSRDLSVTILSNTSGWDRWEIVDYFLENFLDLDCQEPEKPNPLVPFSLLEKQHLKGLYSQSTRPTITIRLENEKLFVDQGGQSYEAQKDESGRLVLLENGAPLIAYTIKRDQEGKVKFLQYWVRAFPKIE